MIALQPFLSIASRKTSPASPLALDKGGNFLASNDFGNAH